MPQPNRALPSIMGWKPVVFSGERYAPTIRVFAKCWLLTHLNGQDGGVVFLAGALPPLAGALDQAVDAFLERRAGVFSQVMKHSLDAEEFPLRVHGFLYAVRVQIEPVTGVEVYLRLLETCPRRSETDREIPCAFKGSGLAVRHQDGGRMARAGIAKRLFPAIEYAVEKGKELPRF